MSAIMIMKRAFGIEMALDPIYLHTLECHMRYVGNIMAVYEQAI